MYKNVNWIKRGAVAAVAAGLMLGALPGVAMAADTVTPINVTQESNVLKKTWTAATNTQLNNTEKFKFRLTYLGAENVGTNAYETPRPFSGVEGTKDVELTAKWKDDAGTNNVATETFNAKALFDGVSFSAPGVYKFNVKEIAGNNPNVEYDSDTNYDIWVTVTWTKDYPNPKTLEIGAIYTHKIDAQGKDKKNVLEENTFSNGSTADKDGKPVVVKKFVSGTGANTSDHFKFKIVVTDVEGSYDYESTAKDDGDIKSGTATAVDGVLTIEGNLAHNEQVSIKGLPEKAKITVTETGANGYDETYVAGKYKNDTGVADGKEFKTDEITVSEAKEITFTNKKGALVETGITMNTLPFVGVAAVAAAGAVTLVISRKRRQGEEF